MVSGPPGFIVWFHFLINCPLFPKCGYNVATQPPSSAIISILFAATIISNLFAAMSSPLWWTVSFWNHKPFILKLLLAKYFYQSNEKATQILQWAHKEMESLCLGGGGRENIQHNRLLIQKWNLLFRYWSVTSTFKASLSCLLYLWLPNFIAQSS